MPIPFAGELAALATSICFSIAPAFFTLAGQRVGSVVVNRTRLLVVVLMLFVVHSILYGEPLPFEAGADRWFWLSVSGVIGLALGDAALFQAFLLIGTRLTMLIFSLSPVLSALLAWPLFGEQLSGLQILGIALTLGGVVWVVSGRQPSDQSPRPPRQYAIGLLFAVGGAVGQALGLITAKFGLSGDFPALSAQVIRLLAGAVSIWVVTLLQGQARQTFSQLRAQPAALRFILTAAIIGPFIGIWFSLVAIQNASVGVASTLMSLPPVFLLPIGYYVFKERYSWRVLLGTAVALGGVALLFLV